MADYDPDFIPPQLPLAQWERMQYKTFRRWCVHVLKSRGMSVKDMQEEFKSGVLLYNILEAVSGKKIPEPLTNPPKMRLHAVNNLAASFHFLHAEKIKLENMGPEDIADGNMKLIFGLVWTIILHYSLIHFTDEGDAKGGVRQLKNALLERLKKLNRFDGVNIHDFKESWQDGLGFCALVADHDPALLDYDGLEKSKIKDNMNNAFKVLEEQFGVPQLLSTDDMMGGNPDEKSILTYLSQAVAALDNDDRSKRRRKEGADAGKSSASGPGLQGAIRNKPATFTVHARDAQGKDRTTGGDSVDVSIKPPAGTPAVKATVKDNNNGTYTVTYTPKVIGEHEIAPHINGGAIAGTPVKVPVSDPEVDPSKSEIKGPGRESGVAGKQNTFTIIAKDSDGALINVGGAPFLVDIQPASGTEAVQTALKDNHNGTYTVTYTPSAVKDHVIGVTLHGKNVADAPIKVSVTAPVLDPSKSEVSGPGANGAVVAEPNVFTITAKDSDGNRITVGGAVFQVGITPPAGSAPVGASIHDNGDGTYTATYQPTQHGSHNVAVTHNSAPLKNCPFNVLAKQSADPNHCEVNGDGASKATVGQPATFNIVAKDANNAPLSSGGDPFTVSISSPSGFIPANVKDNRDGTYTVEYTPSEDGPHKAEVKLRGSPIKNSPFPIAVSQVADPSKCTASGNNLEGLAVGDNAPFKIEARDAAGKPMKNGGSPFKAQVTPPHGSPFDVPVKDNGDGTYGFEWVPKVPGDHAVNVTLNGQPINNKDSKVPVSNGTDPSKCKVSGPALQGAIADLPTFFNIEAINKNGEKVKTGGDPFTVKILAPTSDGDVEQFSPQVKDNNDGTYSISWVPSHPGANTIEVSLKGKPVAQSPYNVSVKDGAPSISGDLEEAVLKEINKARANPAEYARQMKSELEAQYLPDGTFTVPGTTMQFKTKEGKSALDDAVRALSALKPVQAVELNPEFSKSCLDLVKDTGPKGATGQTLSDGTSPADRLKRYGQWRKRCAEIISYGPNTPKMVVYKWLVDDGNSGRTNRGTVLDPDWKVVAVSTGPHANYKRMCACTFAADFDDGKSAGAVAQPDAAASSMSDFEKSVLEEINKLRANPADYAQKMKKEVEDRLDDQGHLTIPGAEARMTTKEGKAGLADAVKALTAAKPVGPLKLSEGLSKSSLDLVKDNGPKGLVGNKLSDGTPDSVRLTKYGQWQKNARETFCYGPYPPQFVVYQWAIDDGNAQRRNRGTLLDPVYEVVGIASGPHSQFKRMCTAAFAGGFTEGAAKPQEAEPAPVQQQPAPVQVAAPATHDPNATTNSDFEKAVLAEINKVRANPAEYATGLKSKVAPQFDDAGKFLIPGTNTRMATREGKVALDDAVAALAAAKPAPPLKLNDPLSHSCLDLVQDNGPKGLTGNKLSDGTPSGDRLKRYGQPQKKVGEVLSYGPYPAETVVHQWLLDDGNAARANRAKILDPDYAVIGIASGPHANFKRMCVAAVAGDCTSGAQAPAQTPAPAPAQTQAAARPKGFSADLDFLKSIETPDGRGYLVDAGVMGTPKESLKLSKNGQRLLLLRTKPDPAGGAPIKSEWVWDMAHDFDANDVTGTYNSATTAVQVFLLKPGMAGEDPNAEKTVASFELKAKGDSPRIEVGLIENATSFVISIGPSKFDEKVVARLKDTTVTFSASHDEVGQDEEGEFVSTVTGKSSIGLPFPRPASAFSFTDNPPTITVSKPLARVSVVDIPIQSK